MSTRVHPAESRRGEAAAVAVLVLAAGLYFAVLELREPYYFLWDDNASFFLPCYAYDHDSLMVRGELPHLNYHQYLGHSHLASGQTAVLYPPLYLGLAVTRVGWGDLRPVVDVLAVLHLVAAALGMYLLLRRLAIRRAASVLASLLWMSFPFLVVVSRSWIFVGYAAAYLPWSLWALERLFARPCAPRVLALAVVKALFFYQGYVQYFVLATLFEGLWLGLRWLFAAAARQPWRRRAAAYAAALAATAALAAPLLLPMLHAKQVSAYRTGSLAFAEFISNSLDLGTFAAAQIFRMEPRAVHLSTGAVFYIGLPVLALLGAFVTSRRRVFVTALGVAAAAFVLSTRAFGVMYHVPVLSSFRWPFKSFLVVLCFLSIAVAGAADAWLGSRRKAVRRIGALLLVTGIAGNVAIVFSRSLDAPFGPNRVDREVAELRREAARRFPLARGRVVSLWLSPLEPEIHRYLIFDYATLVGAYHLGGYDPLIAKENLELALRLEYSNIFRYRLTRQMLDYLSAWSVRFFIVPESRMFPGIDELRPALERFPELRRVYRGDGLEVWENDAASPFAYFAGDPIAPAEVEWGTSSVRVATAGRGGSLRVNVAPLDWYEWTADGRDMGAVGYDEERHLVVEVPAGTEEVIVRYVNVPFRLGLFVFLAFAVSAAATWLVRRRGSVAWISVLLLCAACESPYAARPAAGGAPPPSAEPVPADASLGDGFVVWESNRSGAWRIWIRDLDGPAPRQLTPDGVGRQHCCPHVRPDGRGVAYLSLPRGQELYPESGAAGPLHLIRPDGTGDRVLVEAARTYYEHRAAVWRSPRELVFIDGEGRTRLLALEGGSSRLLTEEGDPAHGWLVNSTLTHATTGRPIFAPYDAEARRIAASRDLGGCQPYFTHDGRWGFWIAGAGGPLRRIDLATGTVGTVLGKSDPRLPEGQNYVYFPMFSPDERLLAFAASRGEHAHFEADYDVFVVETDPRDLEVVGTVRRFTKDPAPDIFPDVYSAPLALGRHFGEAPLTVEFEPPQPGSWIFSANGAEIGRGGRLSHTFAEPGTYEVRARRAGGADAAAGLRGRVTVSPARPPAVVRVELRRGREVAVSFDEQVEASGARLSFASGREIAGRRLDEGGRVLRIELAAELDERDVLTLAGITDRAQVPQRLPATRLAIEPPSWPSDRRGLLFLWETDDAANEVEDPATGAARTCVVTPRGRAFLDRHFAMVTRGGSFAVDGESLRAVLQGCKTTSELTVEATVTPARQVEGPGRILTFSSGDRARNFTLGLAGDHLVFRLRTRTTGPNADLLEPDLGPIPIGRPTHVVVTYTPGRLAAFVDGEKVLATTEIVSGFHHWKRRALLFGNESQNVDRPFYGTVEGVAVYNRVMAAGEVGENQRRYRAKLEERPEVAAIRLRARLRRRSPIPTLADISPYREALAVFEYEVLAVLSGDYSEPNMRVAHRVLLDGERTAAANRGTGQVYELAVEPFFAHPELESLYVADEVPQRGSLFFANAVE